MRTIQIVGLTSVLAACGSGPVELEGPMLARVGKTQNAILYVKGKLDAGQHHNPLNIENLQLVYNAWRQMRGQTALLRLLPAEGEMIHTLAQAAADNLALQGIDERTAPQLELKYAEVTVEPNLLRALGDLVDLAVGTKEAFALDDDPKDPLGTTLCMVVLVEQVLPYQMQRFADGNFYDLPCTLSCVAHQLEATVGWCVWDPDSVLSDPINSVYQMQNYLEFLCKDSTTEAGLCLWQ